MSEIVANPAGTSLAESEAMALAAIDAIDEVHTPEEADALLRRITAYQHAVRLAELGREQERRWGSIRLQAERKMGELLPPAEHGGDRKSDQVSSSDLIGAEREARRMARKVAAVPEDTFTEYVEHAEQPTRAGLLRTAAAPRPEPTPTPTAGVRALAAQHKVVTAIVREAAHLEQIASHLDYGLLEQLPREERASWQSQLHTTRSVITRIAKAL